MNSFWNNNRTLFEKRFPQLYALIADELRRAADGVKTASDGSASYPCGWTVRPAKNGQPTAVSSVGRLHSAYDPGREAEQLALSFNEEAPRVGAFVFLGFGLGYAPLAAARSYPSAKLILVEPDAGCFAAALSCVDWSAVFAHSDCALCVSAAHQSVIALLERVGSDSCVFIKGKTGSEEAKRYFDGLDTLIARNRSKRAINTKTLEKFASLWRRNSCRNLPKLAELDGIRRYKGTASNLSACVLAAGPSLDGVLPYLAEIKERCLLICVDTALRACLRSGVEPDFIVLVDPQYWNARHLDRLRAPHGVLITESAAYPSVFRFDCRETVLCSSMYPVGAYFEARCGEKGKLGAGGSVATSAWDFARACGCREIFIAGLDLGFPDKKTHARGSTFEERAHAVSNRLEPAERTAAAALFAAETRTARSYAGGELLTDNRMSLYAWWFESSAAAHPELKTYSLTPDSLRIPGIEAFPLERLLARRDAADERRRFFDSEKAARDEFEKKRPELAARFAAALGGLKADLADMYALAEAGERLCRSALDCRSEAEFAARYAGVSASLSELDKKIVSSSIAEAASLVFPTEERLERVFADSALPAEPMRESLEKSRVIYRLVREAVRGYQRLFAE